MCFAYKRAPTDVSSHKIVEYMNEGFIFSGFALLQAEKKQDTIETITHLKQAHMQMILMSG